jgi:multidrug efflux system membrane fusion protein
VNVKLLVDTLHNVTLIPAPAIQRNAQGAFAYVIKSDQTASMRTITPGTTDGSVTAVQGLDPQEVVAVNGFDKLLDGAKVTVRTPAKAGGGASGQQPQTGQNNVNQSAPSGVSNGGAASGKNGASHQ